MSKEIKVKCPNCKSVKTDYKEVKHRTSIGIYIILLEYYICLKCGVMFQNILK